MAKVFSLVSCNPCAKLSRGEVGLGGEGGAGEARQGGEGGAGEGEGAISVPVAGCWLTARGDCSGLPAPPRNPGIFHYHPPTHKPEDALDRKSAEIWLFQLRWKRARKAHQAGRQVTTRLRPTTIYSCLLGGRRSSRGTKCDLYIYSKRPREKFIPDSVSHKAGRHFWGCTKVIYPFVKSSLSPCKRFSNVDYKILLGQGSVTGKRGFGPEGSDDMRRI